MVPAHRMSTVLTLISFAWLLSLTSAAVADDEARQVFDSLFAAKLKTVNATADRSDDVALAVEMVALAKTSTTQVGLLALLCDAASDMGMRTANGYAVAIEAQRLLAEHSREKRDGAREKLVTLLARQSLSGKADERDAAGEELIDLMTTMGDEKLERKQYADAAAEFRRAVAMATQRKSAALKEVKAKLDFATSQDRAAKNLARLEEALLKDANDFETAQEIVKLHVFEFNDPESAMAYLNRIKDEQLKKLVPLATKPIAELNEADALELGEWYNSQIKPPANNAYVLSRADDYFSRFLELHTTNDLQRTKAEALLKSIRDTAAPTRISPKFVKLVNVRSKLELAIERGSKAENARTIQWTNTGAPTNQWEIIPVPRSKAIRLKNKYTGKYLCVIPGEQHVLQRSEPSKDGGDQWLVEKLSDGIKLHSVLSKNALAVSESSLQPAGYVIHYKSYDGDEQKWRMVEVKPDSVKKPDDAK